MVNSSNLYYIRNRTKILEKSKLYNVENKKKVNAYQKIYREGRKLGIYPILKLDKLVIESETIVIRFD